MRKKLRNCALSLAFLLACSGMVPAAENSFAPLNFDEPAKAKNETTGIGSSNLQNAILELDSAQIEVRDELLNFKTKFSDIDAKYTVIKAERRALQKQISSAERKIKNIDRTKEKIRNSML
ncbi:MAG: hypothetical protein LBK53_03535 [Heliobacteriaceae bacterium]|jgi:septal ring factor EnvC (AmiA/AmiB activator)|nr:hypothetical protein [Heliobacteriaceae bacterium]